jgi:hypothetical protein
VVAFDEQPNCGKSEVARMPPGRVLVDPTQRARVASGANPDAASRGFAATTRLGVIVLSIPAHASMPVNDVKLGFERKYASFPTHCSPERERASLHAVRATATRPPTCLRLLRLGMLAMRLTCTM